MAEIKPDVDGTSGDAIHFNHDAQHDLPNHLAPSAEKSLGWVNFHA
jgi:hypothetical protein